MTKFTSLYQVNTGESVITLLKNFRVLQTNTSIYGCIDEKSLH